MINIIMKMNSVSYSLYVNQLEENEKIKQATFKGLNRLRLTDSFLNLLTLCRHLPSKPLLSSPREPSRRFPWCDCVNWRPWWDKRAIDLGKESHGSSSSLVFFVGGAVVPSRFHPRGGETLNPSVTVSRIGRVLKDVWWVNCKLEEVLLIICVGKSHKKVHWAFVFSEGF